MKTLFTNWRERDQKNEKQDVALFDVPKRLTHRTIKIADRPLSENPKIVEIPVHEVSNYLTNHFGRAPFTWCETLMGPASFKSANENKTPNEQLEAFFKNPDISDAFVLCFINEKVGFGLFALQDIPKNTLIGTYTGTLQQDYLSSDHTDYYRLQLSNRFNCFFPTDKNKNLKNHQIPHVSAKLKGNLMRFMQCLPNKKDVEQDFMEEAAQRIATANVKEKNMTHLGMPHIGIITTEDIKKGQQVGFDYGPGYFNDRNRMEYFEHSGAVFDYDELSFFNKKSCPQKLAIIPSLMQSNPQQALHLTGSLLNGYHKELLPLFNKKIIDWLLNRPEFASEGLATYRRSFKPDSAGSLLVNWIDVKNNLKENLSFFDKTLNWQIMVTETTNKKIELNIVSKLTSSDAKVLNYYMERLKKVGIETKIHEEPNTKYRRLVITNALELCLQQQMQNELIKKISLIS